MVEEIFQSIAANSEGGTGLREILEYVDARQRVLLTYDELLEGLKQLVESGRVHQADTTHFIRVRSGVGAALENF